MYQLRPYQAEAKDAILQAWDEGQRKTLLVLPTGCGKTIVFPRSLSRRSTRVTEFSSWLTAESFSLRPRTS